jgi:hypothetical protein
MAVIRMPGGRRQITRASTCPSWHIRHKAAPGRTSASGKRSPTWAKPSPRISAQKFRTEKVSSARSARTKRHPQTETRAADQFLLGAQPAVPVRVSCTPCDVQKQSYQCKRATSASLRGLGTCASNWARVFDLASCSGASCCSKACSVAAPRVSPWRAAAEIHS